MNTIVNTLTPNTHRRALRALDTLGELQGRAARMSGTFAKSAEQLYGELFTAMGAAVESRSEMLAGMVFDRLKHEGIDVEAVECWCGNDATYRQPAMVGGTEVVCGDHVSRDGYEPLEPLEEVSAVRPPTKLAILAHDGTASVVQVNAFCDGGGDPGSTTHAWISFGEVTPEGFNPCYAATVVPLTDLRDV